MGRVYIYLHLPIYFGSYGYLRTDGKEAEIDIPISSLVWFGIAAGWVGKHLAAMLFQDPIRGVYLQYEFPFI